MTFASLVGAFFLLYALTAQRGSGWGDSGEFQDWALNARTFVCGPKFSNAHPLYVALCRTVASTPYGVTLVSSLFGALTVGILFLITANTPLAALFGLSQMLWWLSCVAEVQTMNLALTALITLFVVRFLKTDDGRWLAAALFLNGLALLVHNFALLLLPVLATLAVVRKRPGALLAWAIGTAPWLVFLAQRGPADMLVGNYAGVVFGLWPKNATIFAFNLAIAALSFVVPAALLRWNFRNVRPSRWILALLTVNALFFLRYFVPDQSQFLLPTLFFAYVSLGSVSIGLRRAVPLALIQLLLPVLALLVLRSLPLPSWRTAHPDRDEAKYFALPWKFDMERHE